MKLERIVLGHPVCAQVNRLDTGWDIGIYGGSHTHVGAVTMAEADGTWSTLERQAHKDGAVSQRWALALAQFLKAPVCVRCGIHYDNASKEQLAMITASCDEMLRELMTALEQERKE